MLRRLRSGLVIVGCVLVGFLVSAGPGTVARAVEPARWREHLLGSPASTPQSRIAELEARLRELEAERSGAASPGASATSGSAERDQLLARNAELLRSNRALQLENQSLNESSRERSLSSCTPPADEDPKVQLRYWAERMRSGDYGVHGRLNSAQAAALGVLLRPTRPIDRQNPWD